MITMPDTKDTWVVVWGSIFYWIIMIINACSVDSSLPEADVLSENYIFKAGIEMGFAVMYIIVRGRINEYIDTFMDDRLRKNMIYINKKKNKIVMQSESGEIHYDLQTGKPIKAQGRYNPEDWVDKVEFIGKSEEELAEIMRKKCEEIASYKIYVQDNLGDLINGLNVDNLDKALIEEMKNASFKIPTFWGFKEGHRYDPENPRPYHILYDLFKKLNTLTDDKQWYSYKKEEVKEIIDQIKLVAFEVNKFPTHKEYEDVRKNHLDKCRQERTRR